MSQYYIGIMSGTSLDSVDVVLCELDQDQCALIAAHEYPFSETLRSIVLHLVSEPSALSKVGSLHHRLGHLFAQAVHALLAQTSLTPDKIAAIGLHGQTLWHAPNADHPFSMQLGDASIVAVLTGIDVISDFRSKDIALGGQGAPFAPAFHQFLFARLPGVNAVVNIGGMANITIIGEPLLGYDTGPGNVLLDLWIQRHQKVAYDHEGTWAQSGKVHPVLLQRLLQEPYFLLDAPKSTGRERFNEVWLTKKLSNLHVTPADVQATLLKLTALSIADNVKKFPVTQLLVCGSNEKNSYLLKQLRSLLADISVCRTDRYGIDSSFMEAMAFAWLAYKRHHRESVALHSVTGATRDTVLGGIYAHD